MRLICNGCGAPLEPIPGKLKRCCPACGVWTDYRHLVPIGEQKQHLEKKQEQIKNQSGTKTESEVPSKDHSPASDAVFDQVMGWGAQAEPAALDSKKLNKFNIVSEVAEEVPGDFPGRSIRPKLAIEQFANSTNPEDSLPYGITGSTDILCPQCEKALPEEAVLCVHCGFDFQTGEQLKRVHKPLKMEWVEGMSSTNRKLVGILWAGAILVTLLALYQFGEISLVACLIWVFFAIPQIALLVGSFGELKLTRNKKGQIRLTRVFRLGFYPLGENHFQPEGHDGIKCAIRNSTGIFEWAIMAILMIPTLIPGIVFYILVMHKPYVLVAMTRHSGRQESLLFRTRNEEQGREIAHTLEKLTGKNLDFGA